VYIPKTCCFTKLPINQNTLETTFFIHDSHEKLNQIADNSFSIIPVTNFKFDTNWFSVSVIHQKTSFANSKATFAPETNQSTKSLNHKRLLLYAFVSKNSHATTSPIGHRT